MPRSFNVGANFDWRRLLERGGAGRLPAGPVLLTTLLAANVAAAWFVFSPPGGSLEDLESQLAATRQQILARQAAIARLHTSLDKTEQARLAGDAFLNQYFLPRRHAYSRLEAEFDAAANAKSARVKMAPPWTVP